MLSLTTWQRDLLKYLINTGAPVETTALSQQLNLTLRQIRYGMREIEDWLKRQQVPLVYTPRAGLQLNCTAEQQTRLLTELLSPTKFQLILMPEQRQQLLVLFLLAAQDSLILQQLQDDLIISRMTVLKDLETIEEWLRRFKLEIARRQHRGYWIEGNELAKRQALAALLWGDIDQPIMSVQPARSVIFTLDGDGNFLPAARQVNDFLKSLDFNRAQTAIATAELELDVRFTEEAVTLITLAVALQSQRVAIGQHLDWQPDDLNWIKTQVVWPVSQKLATEFWPHLSEQVCIEEAAALSLQFLSNARDVSWPITPETDLAFHDLIISLMQTIAQECGSAQLAHDEMLYEGLDVLLMPAYARQRFGLWSPAWSANTLLSEDETTVERKVASKVAENLLVATGFPLPANVLEDLVLLLRAAIVRAEPHRVRHILVVCPSGMATTQLLVARLKTRFLSRDTFEVLPIRELSTERIARADLLITTVPLTLPSTPSVEVIQVHPMLKSEDIAALSRWLT